MCGRFALTSNPELLAELFALATVPALPPRYNIAPTQPAAVVRSGGDEGGRRLDLLHWGLIPRWTRDRTVGPRLINARSESASTKRVFAEAFRRRRCLVPADGFYEWRSGPGGKQPYLVRLRERGLFAMAGLWERWRPAEGGDAVDSFTILTTTPNDLVAPLHDRMPVIIERSSHDRWLDRGLTDPETLRDLLRPLGADLMTAHPVSRRVNRIEHDDPGCITPVAEPPPDTLFA